MKKCPGCGETKPLNEFHVNKRAKDGRQSRCKECLREYARQNSDRGKERAAEWRRKRGATTRRNPNYGPGTLFPEKES